MAFIQVSMMSESLMRTVPVNVILPSDKKVSPGEKQRENKPYKTLYLLHGVIGNQTDWVNGTNIQRWAEKKNLAVVMPSGENQFYLDKPGSPNQYGEYIGRELVELTRKMFRLSPKREDTYIAGLSMGGYGAIRNGLKYHETFSYIAGLSSANIIDGIENRTNAVKNYLESRDYAEYCFGDLDLVKTSDKNPVWQAHKLAESGAEKPKIYLCCGESDALLSANRSWKEQFLSYGFDVTYEEGPGGHDWDFWNTYIERVLDWLPLEGGTAAISSGNIGF